MFMSDRHAIENMKRYPEQIKPYIKAEKAVRDADSTIRKNQDIIFKRIEASETVAAHQQVSSS